MVASASTVIGLGVLGYGLYQPHQALKEAHIINQATLAEIIDASARCIVKLYSIAVHPKTVPAARIKTLGFLVEKDQSLAGIDLSCKAVGRIDDNLGGENECLEGAVLVAANLEKAVLAGGNLEGAILHLVNLQESDLRFTHLQGASLISANLRKTDLSGANLREADLFSANLEKTKLRLAKLQRADLSHANLKGADLRDVSLDAAILFNVNLEDAQVNKTNFTDANLLEANLSNIWVWSDLPPVNLPIEIELCIFEDTNYRRWQRPDPCIPP